MVRAPSESLRSSSEVSTPIRTRSIRSSSRRACTDLAATTSECPWCGKSTWRTSARAVASRTTRAWTMGRRGVPVGPPPRRMRPRSCTASADPRSLHRWTLRRGLSRRRTLGRSRCVHPPLRAARRARAPSAAIVCEARRPLSPHVASTSRSRLLVPSALRHRRLQLVLVVQIRSLGRRSVSSAASTARSVSSSSGTVASRCAALIGGPPIKRTEARRSWKQPISRMLKRSSSPGWSSDTSHGASGHGATRSADASSRDTLGGPPLAGPANRHVIHSQHPPVGHGPPRDRRRPPPAPRPRGRHPAQCIGHRR